MSPVQPALMAFHLNSVTKGLSPPPRVLLTVTSFVTSGCHQEPSPALAAHAVADWQFILERPASQLRDSLLRCGDQGPSPCCWPCAAQPPILRDAQNTQKLLCPPLSRCPEPLAPGVRLRLPSPRPPPPRAWLRMNTRVWLPDKGPFSPGQAQPHSCPHPAPTEGPAFPATFAVTWEPRPGARDAL